ncbi:MAG: putative aspartate semialdehyde dehydrogenase, partial [Olpidium bornovanus]
MARDCPTQRGRSCSGERPQLNVGVLGATGTVGQRFVLLLDGHPDLRLHALGASAKSAGKVYSDAVRWKLPSPPPAHAAAMVVKGCDPESFVDCDLVFSALDSDVAGEIGERSIFEHALRAAVAAVDDGVALRRVCSPFPPDTGRRQGRGYSYRSFGAQMAFIKANVPVFSNAMNYRNNAAVPLVVPLANPSHLDLIPHQRSVHGVERGFLVTNSNCSTAGLAVVLQALKEAFGAAPDRVMVTTLQAISGAGYPGVASLDILDNVVPYISGEEGKVETEPLKILGSLDPSGAALAPLAGMKISATCNRVPVVDGHT